MLIICGLILATYIFVVLYMNIPFLQSEEFKQLKNIDSEDDDEWDGW